jgi:hypothetical protein
MRTVNNAKDSGILGCDTMLVCEWLLTCPSKRWELLAQQHFAKSRSTECSATPLSEPQLLYNKTNRQILVLGCETLTVAIRRGRGRGQHKTKSGLVIKISNFVFLKPL